MSLPFGKNSRKRPLVFSLVPRSHGWCGAGSFPVATDGTVRCTGRPLFDGVRYDELATMFFAAFLVTPFLKEVGKIEKMQEIGIAMMNK